MEAHLSAATSVTEILQNAGYLAYFAGGWVRDFIMNHPSDDIDIATNAPIEEILKLFPKTIPVGIAFGIVIAIHENHSFEIATFRQEKDYVDGRRPTHIAPASPEEDALRRDFTINGMFYDPLSKKLYDFVHGQEDIEQRCIRAIGNPDKRFEEDRLRMMRAVRYATRFNFTIEKHTKEAIKKHAKDLFPSVAIERVFQEFKKMADFAHFDKSLLLLHELGLLPVIFPELKTLSLFEIEKRLSHILDYPKNTPTILPLLSLFPKASLEKRLSLCDYLKLSKEDKDFVAFFHKCEEVVHMPISWQNALEPVEWAYLYADPRSLLIFQILKSHLPFAEQKTFEEEHTRRRKTLHVSVQRIQEKTPLVSSEDLMQKGIKPGKHLGLLLKEAEKMAAQNALTTKEEILDQLQKTPLWNQTS